MVLVRAGWEVIPVVSNNVAALGSRSFQESEKAETL